MRADGFHRERSLVYRGGPYILTNGPLDGWTGRVAGITSYGTN